MVKNTLYVLILFLFWFAFNSCNENKSMLNSDGQAIAESDILNSKNSTTTKIELSPSDYVQWVKNSENGFFKEKTIDDISFTALYKPYEYIVCIEERAEEIQDSVAKKKLSEMEGMQYFDLKFLLNESQGELLKYKLNSAQEYENRVKYFSFNMQNDIKLVEGQDTIPCSLFHFERAYDVAPFATFLLGFNASKNNSKDKTLIVYDRTFNKGTIKFTFKQNDLQNLPKLKTI